jgi:glycosyltransferase involved in cell wall biosynthesis
MVPIKTVSYLSLQATREGQAAHAHVHEIIKGLESQGWSVTLFEVAYPGNKEVPSMLQRGIQWTFVQGKLWFGKRPTVLYVRSHFAAFPTALWARIVGIPIVQEINGPYETLFLAWPWTVRLKRFFTWVSRIQLCWADHVITVTQQLRDWVREEVGSAEVSVIPNGANTELFYPQAKVTEELSEPYVVFFGALAVWQGIPTLIDAFKHVSWPKEVALVILGDGVERTVVERASIGNRRLVYMGTRPYSDVAGVVCGSIAGLSPQNNVGGRSRTGLSPLKVFETMACGVPIIVTDFPGMADMVREHECGLVIPPENPKALAQAVDYIYSHQEIAKEMGEKGHKAVDRGHSWSHRAVETSEVLLNVIEGKK